MGPQAGQSIRAGMSEGLWVWGITQESKEMGVSHPCRLSLTLRHYEPLLKRDGKLTALEAGVG